MPDAFAREALRRVPLAESVLRLFEWVCHADTLTDLFDRHRGAGQERVLKFTTLVSLIFHALVQHRGSGRQAFQHSREAGRLPVSLEATYGKLRRLPLAVSQAFLAESTDRLRQAVDPTVSTGVVPASLAGMTAIPVDGKTVKRLPKRLKPLRSGRGGILGGKALVALELETGLAVAMAVDPDGDTNDSKLVPALLPQVRARHTDVLWVADRQFCDPFQAHLFLERAGDHLLVRWHKKNTCTPDPSRPTRTGTDRRGRRWSEEWGWMGGPRNAHRLYIRRITLVRPGEEEDILLVTDLLDAERYPAEDLLELYLARWGIERVFQTITEVFELRRLIGTTPQGTLFQLSFCLLLYNTVEVVKGYVARGAGEPVERVSTELLYEDIRRDLVAISEMLRVEELVGVFEPASGLEALCDRLGGLLHGAWTERWRKAPPKKVRPAHPQQKKREHASAHRLIEEYQKKKKPKRPPGSS